MPCVVCTPGRSVYSRSEYFLQSCGSGFFYPGSGLAALNWQRIKVLWRVWIYIYYIRTRAGLRVNWNASYRYYVDCNNDWRTNYYSAPYCRNACRHSLLNPVALENIGLIRIISNSDLGVKKHWIPDPQHWLFLFIPILFVYSGQIWFISRLVQYVQ